MYLLEYNYKIKVKHYYFLLIIVLISFMFVNCEKEIPPTPVKQELELICHVQGVTPSYFVTSVGKIMEFTINYANDTVRIKVLSIDNHLHPIEGGSDSPYDYLVLNLKTNLKADSITLKHGVFINPYKRIEKDTATVVSDSHTYKIYLNEANYFFARKLELWLQIGKFL